MKIVKYDGKEIPQEVIKRANEIKVESLEYDQDTITIVIKCGRAEVYQK